MALEKRTQVRWHPSRYSRRPPKADDRSRNPCASASRYDRRIDLPRVLPLWPHELDDESPGGRRSILGKIRRALRAERRRGVAGHWTYDLARHVELLRIYRLELEAVGVRDTGDAAIAGTARPD